jgi:hypothetical protein
MNVYIELVATNVSIKRVQGKSKKVKFSLCVPKRHKRGVKVQLHSLLTSALDGASGQVHSSAALPP